MLGRATLITALTALGVWLVAAVYAAVVVGSSLVERNRAATNFALVEMGAALVFLAALGIFATLCVFLVTHLTRSIRPTKPSPPASATSDSTPGEEPSE